MSKLGQLEGEVRHLFEKAPQVPGHDYWHVRHVTGYAVIIARGEGYDEGEAKAAALLHDVGRTVNNSDLTHAADSVKLAERLLIDYTSFDEAARERILNAVRDHSKFSSEDKLTQILMDADKLEGLGARGIMRVIASWAHVLDHGPIERKEDGRAVHPEKCANPSKMQVFVFVMEWYDMLATETAKAIARPHYEFMCAYVKALVNQTAEAYGDFPG